MLAGKWTYRSFRNEPALVGDDPRAALMLILDEGVLDIGPEEGADFRGGLGMGSGQALTLSGSFIPAAGDAPLRFVMVGEGVAGSATDGWRYEYRGVAGGAWPGAVDPTPSLIGTLLCVQGREAAGFTASFIAVRQPPPPPRGTRSFVLMGDA